MDFNAINDLAVFGDPSYQEGDLKSEHPLMDQMLDGLPVEIEASKEKYFQSLQRTLRDQTYGDTQEALTFSQRFLPVLRDAVAAAVEGPRSTSRGREGEDVGLLMLLAELDPAKVALAILQYALHVVYTEADMTEGSIVVGKAIYGELWAKGAFPGKKEAAERKRMEKAIKERTGRLSKRTKLVRDRVDWHDPRWSHRMNTKAGIWALDLLLKTLPDLFELVEYPERRQKGRELVVVNITRLALTDLGLGVIQQARDVAIWDNPVFSPELVEPKPWTGFHTGGSHDQRVPRSLLRRHFPATKAATTAAIKDGTMQPTLDALNTLQAVPWTINKRVLGVLNACRQAGLEFEGLPGKPLQMPKAPAKDASEDQQRLFRYRFREAKLFNLAVGADIGLLTAIVDKAEELSQHDRFYTPMNLDWRGRVYGMPYFNFQRDDKVRALFLFADGAPIGEEGIYWLKVHVANCGDFDKVSKRPFADRVAWVDANIERIKELTWTPMKDLWWTKADKPFLFLAACQELASAMEIGCSYVTRLPVSFDGSCSGLQHLCAMTRAPEGSKVNLTANAAPSDVYQIVADEVRAEVAYDSVHGAVEESKSGRRRDNKQLANMLLNYGIDRKLVKRNVMTYCYSSEENGMRKQIMEDTMDPLNIKVLEGKIAEHPFGPDKGFAAASYLAKQNYAAITRTVHYPEQAKEFLRKLAQALAHEAKSLKWTTPAGLPWINRYHKTKTDRVRLWLHDREVRIRVAMGEETKINKEKAANAVSPNFVHALDAAHLLRTTNAARAAGITAMATVHDSFGCRACDAGRFRRIIREEFVRMYVQHDVLREVLEAAKCDLTQHNWDKLPDVPTYGSLDLQEVLDADYAFA